MNHIGSFQFINLIKNKVPFILVSNKKNWNQVYDKSEAEHIFKSLIFVDQESMENQEFDHLIDSINRSQYKNLAPIVIACDQSELSKAIYNYLTDQQFTNCYLYTDDQTF
jgi:hypothetical protein